MAYDQVINNLNEDYPSCLLFGFKVNDDHLGSKQLAFLNNELRTRLKNIPVTSTAFVDITGTCSYTGAKDYNYALGKRRATTVYHKCKDIGLMSFSNVRWNEPQSHGFDDAQRVEPHPPRSREVREKQGDIFRAVDIFIIIRSGITPPSPRPPKLHYFQMRAIYALSLSPPIPILPGISVGADIMMFEIKDIGEMECALYRYRGFNFTLGIPLDKLENAVKIGRLTKIVLQAPGVASGAFAGPWNDFTHRRGPRFYKPVDQWWGAASYFSMSAFNLSLPGWINFGGFDTVPPLRHNAQIDPFDGGATVGFPQISTGEGELSLVTGAKNC